MGDDLRESRDVLSQTQVRLTCHAHRVGTDFLSRKYPEAKAAYEKVLSLDPRHVTALGFLGIVYQMMDQLDAAIVKYHEVRHPLKYPERHSRLLTVPER